MHLPYAIIGGGNMGEAIAAGILRARLCTPDSLVIAEPDTARRKALSAAKVNVVSSASEAAAFLSSTEREPGAGRIILAVKPQVLREVMHLLAPALADVPRLVISILAGTPTNVLSRLLPGARIVRVMPNLPAKLSKGCSAICAGPFATAADLRAARDIFESLGHVHELSEDLMDAFTAVAGSGPAYVFFLAEAMERGAVAAGIPLPQAREIVRQVLTGSAAMLATDPGAPADLRTAVTSKGGTTAAAIDELTRSGVLDAFTRAILAARDRGRELGQDTSDPTRD